MERISTRNYKQLVHYDTPLLAGFLIFYWNFNQLPFRQLNSSSRTLRTELPADYFSGYGILLFFSGLYTD